ncbi:MAG TPA: family 78 glycoside hydrolase catalytic domain, partial [Clostridia bacterium]|nr:family 78 glycoside hydrolase catalytic domain [Clostridia bacterium]
QYQSYDVTRLLQGANELRVVLGKGWYSGRILGKAEADINRPLALIAVLDIMYADESTEHIVTDPSWETARSPIMMSEIYDGEVYDARVIPKDWLKAVKYNYTKEILIPQEGEIVREFETIKPVKLIITPKGEKVLDFGQNLTGYVRVMIKGNEGNVAEYTHAEILDKEGNFYTENLKGADQRIRYICGKNWAIYQPHFTFMGFRYIRIEQWPCEVDLNDFQAVVVHSDIKRTGYFECSNQLVNKLFQNIIWGQRCNFLDVPTDCPQRGERLGWTGDAQVFVRTASYNFDVERFFKKWLHDFKAEQRPDGGVPYVVPETMTGANAAGWGDAAVICPWQIYITYGNKEILQDQFDSMAGWVR